MKVLVAYDGSPDADAAVDDIRNAAFPANTEILVTTIADDLWPIVKQSTAGDPAVDSRYDDNLKAAGAIAERAQQRIQAMDRTWRVTAEPLWGEAATTILKTAGHWKPHVIAVGSHGLGFAGRLILGSIALELVHHAPCTVRVTRRKNSKSGDVGRVLLASDGSVYSEAALQEIERRRWPAGTQIRVLSFVASLIPAVGVPAIEAAAMTSDPAFQVIAAADQEERARLNEVTRNAAARLRQAGLTGTAEIIDGNAQSQIVPEAERWNAGTIFVGARGIGAVDRLLLGSVSSAVVTHAHCTVEVVRQGNSGTDTN